MQSTTLSIQIIIFLCEGRCSWLGKWDLQQSPAAFSFSQQSFWAMAFAELSEKQEAMPSFTFSFLEKVWLQLDVVFLNLFFGYKLRSHTLVALQACLRILPQLVWSIFAIFRYRFDTCPEPTCAAQSHDVLFFFAILDWNSSNSVSEPNLGSKKSAKSTW